MDNVNNKNNPFSVYGGIESDALRGIESDALIRMIEAGVIKPGEIQTYLKNKCRKCKWCQKSVKDDDFCSPDHLEKFMKEHLKKKNKK